MMSEQCRICENRGAWDKEIRVQDIDSGEWFDVYKCPHCRVLRTWPVPEDLSPYYAAHVGQSFKKKGGAFYESLKRILLNHEFRRIASTGSRGPFLDVGAGSGNFTKIIHAGGRPVVAVDAAAEKPEEIRSLGNVAYHTMDYATYEIEGLEPAPYTAVLRHVLEHSKDPRAFLKKLMSYGTETFYISVPNAATLTRYLFGQYWFMWDPPRHLWQFQWSNLKILLESLGLQIIRHGYDISPIWVPSIYRFLAQNKAPKFLRDLFYSRGSLCALLGPLDLLHPKNVIWILCRKR